MIKKETLYKIALVFVIFVVCHIAYYSWEMRDIERRLTPISNSRHVKKIPVGDPVVVNVYGIIKYADKNGLVIVQYKDSNGDKQEVAFRVPQQQKLNEKSSAIH